MLITTKDNLVQMFVYCVNILKCYQIGMWLATNSENIQEKKQKSHIQNFIVFFLIHTWIWFEKYICFWKCDFVVLWRSLNVLKKKIIRGIKLVFYASHDVMTESFFLSLLFVTAVIIYTITFKKLKFSGHCYHWLVHLWGSISRYLLPRY